MMIRLVLTSLAALLAGSTVQAQVGMRSQRAATSMVGTSSMGIGNSACPSGGVGSAGMSNGGSNFSMGGSALGMNQSMTYGTPYAVANNGYGNYNAYQMGTGTAYPANFAAANGFYGGYNTTAGGYNTSQWGNSPTQEAYATVGFGAATMGDMNAYQNPANYRNSIGDGLTDGPIVAASLTKAATDASPRTKARSRKVLSKSKSKATKSKAS